MNKARWSRVERLFEEALDHPADTRHIFISESCRGDTELLAEVESLLAHDSQAPEAFMLPPKKSWAEISSREVDQRIGTKIDRYKILSVIGSGGMGTVYLARQDKPQRDVALKVMKMGLTSRMATKRFELEAQILADLRHPHIAQIFEAGKQRFDETGGRGVLYFAMEYVPNARAITEYAEAKQLTTPQRIELFIQICEAVHHGHQQGVVHRDLKPRNILVDNEGRAKVIDFGVARSTNADMAMATTHTETTQLIGTLQYMSPEQCSGNLRAVDSRSDVYSLGVILYELLTGETPYEVRPVLLQEAIRVVTDRLPSPPSTRNRLLKGDIEIIVLKALTKDPKHRYQSAAGLAEDLRRVVSGQPIMAHPPSLVYLLKRSALRHKWRTAAMLTGVLLFLTVIVLTLTAKWANETTRANEALSAAKVREEVIAYGAAINAAESAVLADDTARARAILDQTKESLRGWEWRHLSYRANLSLWSVAVEGLPKSLAVDPVHRRVAVASDQWPQLEVRSIDTGELLQSFPISEHGSPAVAFSADGRFLASVSQISGPPEKRLSEITIWRYDDGSKVPLKTSWRMRCIIKSMEFGLGGYRKVLAVGTDRGLIHLWDMTQLDFTVKGTVRKESPQIASLQAHRDTIFGLAFQPPDGRLLASVSEDFTARLWDVEALLSGSPKTTIAILRGHSDYVEAVAFSPDGKTLVTGSVDSTIRLWNVPDILAAAGKPTLLQNAKVIVGDERDVLLGHTGPVIALVFDETGERLVSASSDRTLRCWEITRDTTVSNPEGTRSWSLASRRPLGVFSGHEGPVLDVVNIPGGRVLSLGDDRQMKSWSLDTHKKAQLPGHFTSLTDTVFTPDGKFIVTAACSPDDSFIVWDTASCLPLVRRVLRDFEYISSMVCWRNTQRVILAMATSMNSSRRADGRILLWDLTDPGNPSIIQTLGSGHKKKTNFSRIAISRNRERLACGTARGKVSIWDVSKPDQPRLINELMPHKTGISSLQFVDSNGDWVVSAGNLDLYASLVKKAENVDIKVSAVDGHQRAMVLSGCTGVVQDVAINRRMNRIACASKDRTIRLWDIKWENGVPVFHSPKVFKGHTKAVVAICFHPLEHRLVSASEDRTLKVWNTDMGVEVATLKGSLGTVRDLEFDPQGERLALASSGMLGTDNVTWLLETGLGTGLNSEQSTEPRYRRAVVQRAHEEVRKILQTQSARSLDEVLRMIEEDHHLSEEVRNCAVRNLRNFLPNPIWFHTRIRQALKRGGPPEELREELLEWAKLAVEMAPESKLFRATLNEIKGLTARERNVRAISSPKVD